MSGKLSTSPVKAPFQVAVAGFLASALLFACGGGGGGGGEFAGGIEDPVVPLRGTGGTYSRTPQEANNGNGGISSAPPTYPVAVVNGENHFIRLDFPFDVDPASLLDPDVNFAPFSQLNGNLTITDQNGNHLPGIAIIDGRDVFGEDRTDDIGWPADLSGSGRDRNIGSGRFVYIATDPGSDQAGNELESVAAFGGRRNDSDNDPSTTDITQIRVSLNQVNGQTIDGFWTINVGTPDVTAPAVVNVIPTVPVEGQPRIEGKISADVTSEFLVVFNEPVVPQSVSLSAVLNQAAFNGNLPAFSWPNPPTPPLPHAGISSPSPPGLPNPSPLFIPFDCNPVNKNNLSKYRLKPLITLPAQTNIIITVRATSVTQTTASMDLRGNLMIGGDALGDFQTGTGPALVNAPVCPEAIYWTPITGQGLGVIDLNGLGFTTNAPHAFDASDIDKTSIITKVPDWNTVSGRARDGNLNNYRYPIGTGSQALGYVNSPGNPGTPIPGVNEKSDGFETFVKNSQGEQNLTSGARGVIGKVTDIQVGDALDILFYDTLNFFSQNSVGNRFSRLIGPLVDNNSMSDPPTPNPPPLRYALGLPPIGFVVDNTDPEDPIGFLIEGEEVFGIAGGSNGAGAPGPGPDQTPGNADDGPISRIMLLPNHLDPDFGPDLQPMPFIVNGPPPQSSTSTNSNGWTQRQQIGNNLYLADQTNNELRVVNSNTMRVISSIALPDPFGLAIAPNMRQLFVTNFGDDTVSVVSTDPFESGYHEEVNRIFVGGGPRSVAVQPDFEDVLVLNWVGDSMSIIDPGRGIVRKEITALINAPYDVVVGDRQIVSGFGAGIYFAYISNFGGNSVLVFESGPDSPPNQIGLDNIIGEVPDDADQGDVIDIIEPRYMTYDPDINSQGLYAGGSYVTHRDADGNGVVSRIQFTFQAQFGPIPRNPPPGFFIPPGFSERRFEVVSQWGHTPESRLAGGEPSAVAVCDLSTSEIRDPAGTFSNLAVLPAPVGIGANNFVVNCKHPLRGAGAAYFPDRLYVSFADSTSVQVLDPTLGGVILKTIEGTTNIGRLFHYWSQ